MLRCPAEEAKVELNVARLMCRILTREGVGQCNVQSKGAIAYSGVCEVCGSSLLLHTLHTFF